MRSRASRVSGQQVRFVGLQADEPDLRREWPLDAPESGRDLLMQPGQVDRVWRQPAEVDLEAVTAAVRREANRQVGGRAGPQHAGPPDGLRMALALATGGGARLLIAAAQLELDGLDAVDAVVAGG